MSACNCVSSSISSCGNYSAGVTCLATIHQGSDHDIEIQLMDDLGYPLDLDRFISIQIFVYDESDTLVAFYTHPEHTSYDSITILQSFVTGSSGPEIEDQGLLSIRLNAIQTCAMMTGGLSVEIKLEEDEEFVSGDTGSTDVTGVTGTSGSTKTTIISCFKIGKVVATKFVHLEEPIEIDLGSLSLLHGGTIDGDLVVTGDLTVEGNISVDNITIETIEGVEGLCFNPRTSSPFSSCEGGSLWVKEDTGGNDLVFTNNTGTEINITEILAALQAANLGFLKIGDNISLLNNDAGYITLSEVPNDVVTSVNSKIGDIILYLNDLGDVNAPTPVDGQVLKYQGGEWIPSADIDTNSQPFITIIAGKNRATTDSYLYTSGGVPMNISPFILPFDAYLTHISASTNIAQSWIAEVHKNLATVPGAQLVINTSKKGLIELPTPILYNAGDEIAFYVSGTGILKPSMTAIFVKV